MNLFLTEISRTNRNKAVLWVAVTLLGMYLIYNNIPYMRTVLTGSTPLGITETELASSTLVTSVLDEGFHYVQMSGDVIEYTGIEEVTTRYRKGRARGSYTSGYYHLLFFQNNAVIVKTSDLTDSTTVRGVLRPLESDIKSEIPFFESELLQDKNISPLYINAEEYTPFWGYLYLTLISIGVIGLVLLSFFIIKPQYSALMRKAKKSQIDTTKEYSPLDVLQMGLINATPTYLMYKGWFGTQIINLDTVLWMFQLSKPVKKFFFFTVGHKHHVSIHLNTGHSREWETSQVQIDNLLAFIAKHRPEITLGDSEELQKRFNTDLEGWINEVEEKRKHSW